MHTTIRTRRRRQLAGVLAATATTAVVLTGCAGTQAAAPAQSAAASSTVSTSSTAAASPTTTSAGASAVEVALASAPVAAGVDTPAQADAALAMLDTLEVKGRAPKTGYDRDLFGQAWTDDVTVEGGHNGCDTRNDLLRRDFSAVVLKPGSNGCVVESGVLADPYTGTSHRLRPRAGHVEPRCRSTTSSPCRTRGRRAPSSWTPSTRDGFRERPAATCRPSTGRSTSRRATATPRPGCRRTRPTAAPTSPARSR